MIVRTYACNDCGAMYEVECGSNDGDPDCPACSAVLQWRPQSFAIGGSVKSKAVDLTQNIMEKDFGLADMKDNVREGEAYFKPPPPKQAAEIEAETRRDVEITRQTGGLPPDLAAQVEHSRNTFFGGGQFVGGGIAGGLSTAAASRHEPPEIVQRFGKPVDGMVQLHANGKAGKLPTRARIIARG